MQPPVQEEASWKKFKKEVLNPTLYEMGTTLFIFLSLGFADFCGWAYIQIHERYFHDPIPELVKSVVENVAWVLFAAFFLVAAVRLLWKWGKNTFKD